VKDLFASFIMDTIFLEQLTKLCQTSMVEDYIYSFEHLVFRTKNLINEVFKQCFISGLKEEI
jgi:hypothetical protein